MKLTPLGVPARRNDKLVCQLADGYLNLQFVLSIHEQLQRHT